MKAIKITPEEIIEIDNFRNDPFMKETSGYVIDYPTIWKYKKFRLCIFTKDLFNKNDKLNKLATDIWNKLKSPYNILDHHILGDVIITNEKDDSCDFTKEDILYIIEKMKIMKR